MSETSNDACKAMFIVEEIKSMPKSYLVIFEAYLPASVRYLFKKKGKTIDNIVEGISDEIKDGKLHTPTTVVTVSPNSLESVSKLTGGSISYRPFNKEETEYLKSKMQELGLKVE